MLKQKTVIKRWAAKMLHYEEVLGNPDSSEAEKKHSMDFIESAISLYERDSEKLMYLVFELEKQTPAILDKYK